MSEETTETNTEPTKAAPKKTAAKGTAAKKTSQTTAKKAASTTKRTMKKTPVKKAAPRKTAAANTTTSKVKTSATPKKTASSKAATTPEPDHETHSEAPDIPMGTEAAAEERTSDSSSSHSSNFSTEQLKSELKDKDWAGYAIRGVLMVLFGFLAWFATLANFVLAGVQFVILILTGGPNELIRRIIMVLGRYIVDVMQYLSFESDEPPFPLGKDFPDMD